MGGRISVPNCGDRRANSRRSLAPGRDDGIPNENWDGAGFLSFLQKKILKMMCSLFQPNLSQKHATKENGVGSNSVSAFYAQFQAIFKVPNPTV
jgi:hypothetical protein